MIFNAEEYKKQLLASTDIKSCPKVPLPQINENENYIFISYSHKDYKHVYADLADMYVAGVRFWYDKGLSAGKKWDEEVQEKLLHANCVGVIFFMSKNLFLSQSANKEIQMVCTLASNNEMANQNTINYFSVNLTEKLPIQILSESMQDTAFSAIDMSMISVLAKAFPDNAYYLYYSSPEHTTELISQIQSQFGVISTQESPVVLHTDTASSSVFIGTLGESLSSPKRKELVNRLCGALGKNNISSYVMQEESTGYMSDAVSDSLKEYIKQQNELKLEKATSIVVVCSVFGWSACARFFGEFDLNVTRTKNIYYLVCSEEYGDSEEFFLKHLGSLYNDENYKELFSRVFFKKDSEENIVNAIKNNTDGGTLRKEE